MSPTTPILTWLSAFILTCISTIVRVKRPLKLEPKEITGLELTIHVKQITGNLLQALQYRTPETDSERRSALEQALCSEFSAYCGTQTWFKQVCAHAAAMAELSYHNHSFDIQRQISRFTWFMIYFDDLCHESPLSLQNLQQTMLSDTQDEDPILEHFRKHLREMYHFWDPISANFITTSALEYINGCLIEELPSFKRMSLSTAAKSWPYYLRSKTGVAAAYAFMIFPSHARLDITIHIQVISDISTFIDLTNDVLSFYKESCAGEKHNYIHNQAFVTGKSALETLRDVEQEIVTIHSRISQTLKLSDEYISWKKFVNGYLAFHVTQTRYRLMDLGL